VIPALITVAKGCDPYRQIDELHYLPMLDAARHGFLIQAQANAAKKAWVHSPCGWIDFDVQELLLPDIRLYGVGVLWFNLAQNRRNLSKTFALELESSPVVPDRRVFRGFCPQIIVPFWYSRPGILVCFILILTGIAPAQKATDLNALNTRACADMSQSYVTGRLNLWQQRLKLQDWKIFIIMAHRGDLKPDTLGNIQWDASDKSAILHVLDASEYQLSCREMLNDMEFTVVHELIHLELSSLPRSEASRHAEEYAVNQIVEALLALDRRK